MADGELMNSLGGLHLRLIVQTEAIFLFLDPDCPRFAYPDATDPACLSGRQLSLPSPDHWDLAGLWSTPRRHIPRHEDGYILRQR